MLYPSSLYPVLYKGYFLDVTVPFTIFCAILFVLLNIPRFTLFLLVAKFQATGVSCVASAFCSSSISCSVPRPRTKFLLQRPCA